MKTFLILLLTVLPFYCEAQQIEAETFDKSLGGATADSVLHLWSARWTSLTISIPAGQYIFRARTYGDVAPKPEGFPVLRLASGAAKEIVGQVSVPNETFNILSVNLRLPAITTLWLSMYTDYRDSTGDRNLHVDWIEFQRVGVDTLSGKGEVTLSWNANAEKDLAGYRIYFGTDSTDLADIRTFGKITSFIFEFPAGIYYFAITAFDLSGNESALSEIVRAVIPESEAEIDVTPPAAPVNVTVRVRLLFQSP